MNKNNTRKKKQKRSGGAPNIGKDQNQDLTINIQTYEDLNKTLSFIIDHLYKTLKTKDQQLEFLTKLQEVE
jgi:hypothetical protein